MVNPLLWLPIEEAWFDLRQLFAIQVQYFREELFGSFARTTPTAIIVNVQQAPRNKPAVSGLADGSRAYSSPSTRSYNHVRPLCCVMQLSGVEFIRRMKPRRRDHRYSNSTFVEAYQSVSSRRMAIFGGSSCLGKVSSTLPLMKWKFSHG